MVVGERVPRAGHEHPPVTEIRRHLPHPLHDLRRDGERVAFLIDLQVLVPHHVEEHRVEGLVPGRLVSREPARSDQHLVRVGEVAEVLPVVEQQVHTHGGRALLEGVGDAEQHGHAGRPVVRPGDWEALLPQVLALVGVGTGVPVREEQHAIGGCGLEPGDEVAQLQRLAVLGDVTDLLHDHGVGAGT